MENGRCRYHGGKTPKGKDWHRITRPANADKATAKMGTLERRAKQRAQRLAKMTAEEQAQYRAWRQSHTPGPPEAREARKQQRKQNAEIRARGAAHARSEPSAEMRALLDRITDLKAMQKELTKQTEQMVEDGREECEIFR
ncbi:hypothetical protein QWZ10_09035 [Paracoccus cavernae]|uniref:Uncharacterized protein n=2 Tax=Paracoccus cavernae TaxID=1571207 RepID=A0ABT8D5Z8_9RHOB|nr:hypothetical protein [Paracoccus cavernae]